MDAATGRLARFYDTVLVHGDPAIVPLEASWPVDAVLRERMVYTGYVDDGDDVLDAAGPRDGSIVVSGGSSAAALPLCRAALEAARALPDRRWHILVGHGITDSDQIRLAAAAPCNATVERARADFRQLLRRADLFVGQAGYNTVTDLFATGVRAVLVPFEEGGETEQRLRADTLARCGLARVLTEDRLTPAALADEVARSLGMPSPGATAIRRDGARETVRVLTDMLRRRPASPRSRRAALA